MILSREQTLRDASVQSIFLEYNYFVRQNKPKCMNVVLCYFIKHVYDVHVYDVHVYDVPFTSCGSFSHSEHPLKDMPSFLLPGARGSRY